MLFIAVLPLLATNPYEYIMKQRQESNAADFAVKKEAIKPEKSKEDTFLDSVIATDIQDSLKAPQYVSYAKNAKILADNKKTLTLKQKSQPQPKIQSKPVYYFVGGYCRVEQDIKIFGSDGFGELRCDLNFGKEGYKKVSVFTKFVPDYKREVLLAFPLYVKIGNVRATAQGYFMNSNKTSLNVADYIDSARIKTLLSKSLLIANDIAYKQATAYMKALQNAQQTQQVTYYNTDNNTVPIVTTNYQKPNPRDYWGVGLVELTSALIRLFGEDYLNNLKPLFKVNKNTLLYTEMVIKEDNASVYAKFGEIEKDRIKAVEQDNKLYQQQLFNGVGGNK